MQPLHRLVDRHRRLVRDDRAIAINLVIFAVGLLAGAALIVIFDEPISMMIEQGQANSSSDAAGEGWFYLEEAWFAFPLLVVGLSTLQLIAAAAFRR